MSLFVANCGVNAKPAGVGGGGGGTPPEFIAASSIVYDNSTPVLLQPDRPTHEADDILIAVGACFSDKAMESSQWTEFADGTNASGMRIAAFWKRAVDNATGNADIEDTPDTGGEFYGICYVFRGCVTSGTPVEDATITGNNSSSAETSAIDTTGDDRLVVAVQFQFTTAAFSSGFPPSGWDAQDDQTTTLGSDAALRMMTKEQASAGTVSAVTMGNFGGSVFWETLTFALIPE